MASPHHLSLLRRTARSRLGVPPPIPRTRFLWWIHRPQPTGRVRPFQRAANRPQAVRDLCDAGRSLRLQRAKFDAKVTLIHVIQIPIAWYGGTETAYPVAFDVSTIQKELRVALGRFLDSE